VLVSVSCRERVPLSPSLEEAGLTQDDRPSAAEPRSRFTEDWAATILGLVLMVLAMAGVITKAWVP
jgi:hypothetical protein